MIKRKSVNDVILRKGKEPIAMLTAYTAPIAKILDAHCDIMLVGDSLGMVIYGMENTIAVTVQMMINHGKAVVDSSRNSLVVVDMPFGSYQQSKEQAFKNAAKIIARTKCQAVKLEGGVEMAETIEFLTQRAIPVMAHIGLQPQYVNIYGGYSYQGKTTEQASKIMEDAIAVEKAGAFAVVIEAVPENLAAKITAEISIPTIGIGASYLCDGQVLVIDDMLGLFQDFTPKFVKKYADIASIIDGAVSEYVKEVKLRDFPTKEHMK